MKNILVTGGSGFIGSQIVKTLNQHPDYTPWVVDWDVKPWRLPDMANRIFECDFCSSELWDDIQRRDVVFDAVIHLAAFHVVPESMTEPYKFYNNNVTKTIDFIKACRNMGIKHFIYSGSSSVYGNNGMEDIEVYDGNTEVTVSYPHALAETDPLDPGSPYASTKAIVEMILKDYSRAYDMTYMSLRYFNAAGADPDGQMGYVQEPATHIVPVITNKVFNNELIKIFGNDYPSPDGTCVRDYTHVQDLANAHVLAVDYLLKGGENQIVNLGAGEGTSLLELLQACEDVLGREINWEYAPRRPGDPPYLMADISKAKEVLGWEPQYTLCDIIAHDWAWSQNRKLVGGVGV